MEMAMERETEYGIRERRFQAIDLKKIYIQGVPKFIPLLHKSVFQCDWTWHTNHFNKSCVF